MDAPALPVTHCIVYDEHGAELHLVGRGYATRSGAVIAQENWPDARWTLAVLNQFGHLVLHEADQIIGCVGEANRVSQFVREG